MSDFSSFLLLQSELSCDYSLRDTGIITSFNQELTKHTIDWLIEQLPQLYSYSYSHNQCEDITPTVRVWNNLPSVTPKAETAETFKSMVKMLDQI